MAERISSDPETLLKINKLIIAVTVIGMLFVIPGIVLSFVNWSYVQNTSSCDKQNCLSKSTNNTFYGCVNSKCEIIKNLTWILNEGENFTDALGRGNYSFDSMCYFQNQTCAVVSEIISNPVEEVSPISFVMYAIAKSETTFTVANENGTIQITSRKEGDLVSLEMKDSLDVEDMLDDDKIWESSIKIPDPAKPSKEVKLSVKCVRDTSSKETPCWIRLSPDGSFGFYKYVRDKVYKDSVPDESIEILPFVVWYKAI